jgi:hypothetical protein
MEVKKNMRPSNKKVIKQMQDYILKVMYKPDIKRYFDTFPREYDFNIYQYVCLDVYDYDLYKRLLDFGVNTKAITEYTKVLNDGCTHKHRKNVRNTYKQVVRYAVQNIIRNKLYAEV